jgi:hypothetical protein
VGEHLIRRHKKDQRLPGRHITDHQTRLLGGDRYAINRKRVQGLMRNMALRSWDWSCAQQQELVA